MATMLMVSCRKDFWSPTEFASVDQVRRVDLSTGESEIIGPGPFLEELTGQRVTVLVHGYNNERLDVVASYATIDAQMRLLGFLGGSSPAYDALVGFAWPGGASGVSFPFARQRAVETAPRFAALLAGLRSANAIVDLNTHSLGAHVVFEALRDSAPRAVRNAWNFASAVDNESIEQGERYHGASRQCERFYVFHSKNDSVLRVWYRIGDLFNFDTALGYSGPEDPAAMMAHSPHARIVNCKDVVQSHGGYRSSGQVWAYMAQELRTPGANQFVTLAKTPEALRAVFRQTATELSVREAAPLPAPTRRGRKARPRATSRSR